MRSSSEYIDKLNQVLSNKSNADVYIINDKLTLSVFSVLEKSLRNVRRIYLIIRDNPHLPKDEVSREFEMNPNDSGTSRSGIDLERFDWSRFDLIVIDESHNFHN